MVSLLAHICVTRTRWFNTLRLEVWNLSPMVPVRTLKGAWGDQLFHIYLSWQGSAGGSGKGFVSLRQQASLRRRWQPNSLTPLYIWVGWSQWITINARNSYQNIWMCAFACFICFFNYLPLCISGSIIEHRLWDFLYFDNRQLLRCQLWRHWYVRTSVCEWTYIWTYYGVVILTTLGLPMTIKLASWQPLNVGSTWFCSIIKIAFLSRHYVCGNRLRGTILTVCW